MWFSVDVRGREGERMASVLPSTYLAAYENQGLKVTDSKFVKVSKALEKVYSEGSHCWTDPLVFSTHRLVPLKRDGGTLRKSLLTMTW